MSEPRTDGLDTIADCVDALTNPMDVRERYEVWKGNNRATRWHQHRMPPLLHQLERAAIPGEVYAEDADGTARRMPASCPPARLEAINLELALTAWAADTVWRTHQPVRETTTANLRALVGARVDSDHRLAILEQLRRWVHQARVIASWERPPWRPDTLCPACDKRGTIRVRLDLSVATCKECGEGWDHKTIGLLADHVRRTTQRPVLA